MKKPAKVFKKAKPKPRANGRPPKGDKKMKAGRPSVFTPETLGKLEQAFSIGCTDLEACLFANIHPSSLYDYQEKNPGYSDRKEMLKKTVQLKARSNVAGMVNRGDDATSKWYLERKAKDEFSTKTENDVNASVDVTVKDIYNEIVPEDEVK